MATPGDDVQAPGTTRVFTRAFLELTGWGILLGALYLPAAITTLLVIAGRLESGEFGTVGWGASPTGYALWLALLGGVLGIGIGILTGVVVGLSLSWSAQDGLRPERMRVVGAIGAATVVGTITGLITVWLLAVPSDALLWDFTNRPLFVLFALVLPTALGAAVAYLRTPRIVASAAR